jgi:hypothetical protein
VAAVAPAVTPVAALAVGTTGEVSAAIPQTSQ